MFFRWLFRRSPDALIPIAAEANEAQAMEAISQAAASDDPFAVPGLIQHLFSARPLVRNAAMNAVGKLLAAATPAQLPNLDERVRASASASYSSPWQKLQPEQLEAWTSDARAAALLGVASFHPNGRIREAAVRRMAALPDARVLGFLLVRANDWVEPVRLRAEAAALIFASVDHSAVWVRHLPLVSRLEHCGRGSHGAFISSILKLLREPACQAALVEGLGSADRHVARACFRVVETMDAATALPLLEVTLESRDPLLRLRAAVRLLEQTSLEELPSLSKMLAPSARTRQALDELLVRVRLASVRG